VENLQRFAQKIAKSYHNGNYDMLVSPTMRIPPTKLGDFEPTPDHPDRWLKNVLSFVAFTRTQNITGQPAMSVPLYWNQDSIPVGVQFTGRFGEEGKLFRLAAQLSRQGPGSIKYHRSIAAMYYPNRARKLDLGVRCLLTVACG